MPIKYAGRYSPKYYNPNWGPYSHKKLTWDAHHKKKSTTPTASKTSSSSTKPTSTTK